MTRQPTIFADAAFYIALTSRRDADHANALAWQRWLSDRQARTITTEPVLWEWLSFCAPPPVRGAASAGYQRLRADANVEIVEMNDSLRRRALAMYGSHADKSWSAVDCLSFVIMADRGTTPTDRHFGQAGFEPLMLREPPTIS